MMHAATARDVALLLAALYLINAADAEEVLLLALLDWAVFDD